jgi:ferritin
MLLNTVESLLNKQIGLEFFSSNLYLQMSIWADKQGLPGLSSFLATHADEEMTHMKKILKYLLERDALPILGKIKAPESNYLDVETLLNEILEHEKLITKQVNDLSAFALKKKDMTTFHFLQWFIEEQLEEETLFRGILDQYRLAKAGSNGLFLFDQGMMAASIQSSATAK